MHYFIFVGNQTSGPYDISDIIHLFQNEAINADTQIKTQSQDSEWTALGESIPIVATLPTISANAKRTAFAIQQSLKTTNEKPNFSSIVDVDMKFGSMIVFMIKWAIAAIPAAIILFVLGYAFTLVIAAMAAK